MPIQPGQTLSHYRLTEKIREAGSRLCADERARVMEERAASIRAAVE